jgi:hypothetical protein
MLVRFDHIVSINPSKYEKALKIANKPKMSDSELDFISSLKPSFKDIATKRKRVAGFISLTSITASNFTGNWWITDGDTSSDRAYETMLEQNGIPKSVDYTAYSHVQHLVGGVRLDEDRFAVTSIFDADEIPGCSTSKLAMEKQRIIYDKRSQLISRTYPELGSFGYDQFIQLANEI